MALPPLPAQTAAVGARACGRRLPRWLASPARLVLALQTRPSRRSGGGVGSTVGRRLDACTGRGRLARRRSGSRAAALDSPLAARLRPGGSSRAGGGPGERYPGASVPAANASHRDPGGVGQRHAPEQRCGCVRLSPKSSARHRWSRPVAGGRRGDVFGNGRSLRAGLARERRAHNLVVGLGPSGFSRSPGWRSNRLA